MRVLVTGAAGSIGRVVTVGLADRGHEVVGLDLVPAPDGYDGPWHERRLRRPATPSTAVFAESSGSTPSSTWPASPTRRRCPTRSPPTS